MEEPDESGPWGRPTPVPPRRRRNLRLLLSFLVFALLVAALLSIYATDPAWSQSAYMAFVRVMIIALPLVAWIAHSSPGLRATVRYAVLWAGLGLAIIVVYGYQTEISAIGRRTLAALRPGQSEVDAEGSVSFFAARDHHFCDAVVNDKDVRFLLDTGASAIVLTKSDAARLGFGADQLVFNKAFETANGVTHGAPILLNELRIGPIVFREVSAWVNQGDLTQSLLGMGFLSRLSEVVITPDRLTIRR